MRPPTRRNQTNVRAFRVSSKNYARRWWCVRVEYFIYLIRLLRSIFGRGGEMIYIRFRSIILTPRANMM